MNRLKKITSDPINQDLIFQITSWYTSDYEYDMETENEYDDACKYLIKVFGSTQEGHSVSLNIVDYTPYFFIKIHHKHDRFTAEHIHAYVVGRLPRKLKNSLIDVVLLKKKDFWGFTNNEKFIFARLKFKSLNAYKSAVRMFYKKVDISSISRELIKYKLYESNIDPFIRMMHIRDIQPCGWIELKKNTYGINTSNLLSHCQIDIECKWNVVMKCEKEKIAPIVVASFDLECTSSHGDFPIPRKNYAKVSYELLQYYNIHKLDAYIKYTLQNEILKIFDPSVEGVLSKVFTKEKIKITDIENKLKKNMDELFAILSGKLNYKYDPNKPQKSNYFGKIQEETDDEKGMNKDAIMIMLTQKLGNFDEDNNWDGIFPPLEGDCIIQIGTTVHCYGENECNYKNILTLGTCDPIDGIEVISCETEQELLMKWRDLIIKIDPDIITGYNIFGFDMQYLYWRSKELGICNDFCKLGRIIGHKSEYVEKALSSSALGDNLLKYIDMEGRVLIDIMKIVQRDHKLDSYKLDNVASHFMKMNKNDVHPSDIFRLQKGTSADRKIVAEYCVMDCTLCNHLMMKLEILANNIGMSNVCNVPLSFIFMRGQGIKIFSLVAKECRSDNLLIPTLSNFIRDNDSEIVEDEEGYEGAIVLEPKEGIYTEDVTVVLDYASLYPSSMISENLSHDSIILQKKYDNLPGVEYLDISYDVFEKIDDKKVKTGEKTVRFAQFQNGEKGTIPKILMKLLSQRKETRKKIEFKTITTNENEEFKGLFKEKNDKIIITSLDGQIVELQKENVVDIKDTYDDFQKAVLDGLQNAYKITANSLYGQCGAKTSSLFMKEIAACTAATGRKMILEAKQFIEKKYDAKTIYGDSVTGDTPLIIKFNDNTIDIISIECLTKKWIDYNGFKIDEKDIYNKEQSFIDAEVWTNGKWAKIHRVIRHKCNKKIYRVNTFKGCVDVTEDHSLIDINGEEIKPGQCIEGETMIMHSFPNEFNETFLYTKKYKCDKFKKLPDEYYKCKCCNEEKLSCEFYYGEYLNTSRCRICINIKTEYIKGNKVDTTKVNTMILNYNIESRVITKEEAWVWGLFFGDGSCGEYDCESGKKNSWVINNSNLEYLNKARDYLLQNEPKNIVSDFKILDTIDSSAVYKLVPTGSLVYMVEKYRELFYDKDKFKKVPKIILNATREIRKWFLEGYLTADGCKRSIINGGLSFACKGKIGSQGLYYIAKSIGWDKLRINIQDYKENTNTYWISYIKTDKYYDQYENQVIKIFDLEKINDNEEYVYDIETNSGKFHGGVGEIVLKNTDSLFIQFDIKNEAGNSIKGKDAIMPSIKIAMEASKDFKQYLKAPHDLEYEKTFFPFILFSKKRYCANKYEFDDEHYKFNSMGIALRRRDNAQIVKHIYGGCIDIILKEHDIKKSIKFLQESLDNLIEGKYPLNDLVISKSLRSGYKDPTRIAHNVLATRMADRDPGNKPQVSDRIPYVYIQVKEEKGKSILQGNRIESPDFIKKNKLKPDYEFYITNQILKPIVQLYALVLEELEGYRKNKNYYKDLYPKLLKDKCGDEKKTKDKWHDLKEAEVKALLFDSLLIKLKNKKQGLQDISKFFQKNL
jgi:DNA polymerase elongation subunit (family B)